MKRERRARLSRVPRPRRAAEEIDGDGVTMDRVLQMLTGDFYFHQRISRALSQAGFSVEHLERGKGHGIWLGSVRAAGAELSRDTRLASRELRTVFKRSGLRIKAADLTVYERSKDAASFSLVFPFGCSGVVDGCA